MINIIENDGILTVETDQSLFYYQWYLNGSAINGANGPSLTPLESGIYTVYAETRVCGSLSPDFPYISGNINVPEWSDDWKIYPNPFVDELITELPIVTSGKVLLTDMRGQLIRMTDISKTDKVHLFFGDLIPGSYLLKIITPEFVLQHVIIRK